MDKEDGGHIKYSMRLVLHALVIVHRDITSNNILLNFELEASIADFCMTKLLDPNSFNQTLIAGTYGYVVPGELFFYIRLSR